MIARLEMSYALIVEDCHDTAQSLSLLLSLWGYHACIARTGLDALRLAAKAQPAVVLLDIDLPLLNGWEVAKQLRQMPGMEDTLLIALTGYGHEEHRGRSRAVGCDLHLTKPVDPEVLHELLAASSPLGLSIPGMSAANSGGRKSAFPC